MGKHAFLSASASHRWLECPPSAKLCSEQEDRASPYAQQGTDCHELCAYLVEKSLGRNVEDAKRGGGRTRAFPHIAPAEQKGIEQLTRDIERDLRKGG